MAPPVRDRGAAGLTRDDDTIFALATGAPPAAITIMRVSGPAARTAAVTIAGSCPAPRQASLRTLRHGGEVFDQAVVLFFPGPASATGEDVAEFHIHGGRAVGDALTDALATIPACRRAAAGEFTRRAFANGRIDLLQAEGLADLLAADTASQRRAALALAVGHLSRKVIGWLDSLTTLSARLEVAIDYADEEDGGGGVDEGLHHALKDLRADMRRVLSGPSVERITDGTSVVLAGPPNAGKSSLFNALAGADIAIVTPVPGTTRDRLETRIVVEDRVVRLIDTAGDREDSDDPIERIGIERGRAAVAGADLVLWLGDDPPEPGRPAIWVWSRFDLPERRAKAPASAQPVSVMDAASVRRLWEAILATEHASSDPERALNQRQRDAIGWALETLDNHVSDSVLLAEQLRVARVTLGRLTGRGGTEDLLSAIFGRFCLGK